MDPKLKELYEDPSDIGSFGGVERLFQSAKAKHLPVTRKQVVQFLKAHRGYTLHKPYRRHYTRNPTIVSGIDVQWQADLVDMHSLSRSNEGTKFILTVIDCFSKYAWAYTLKNKTGAQIITAFKDIFDTSKRTPKKVQTDKGKEFINKEFQAFLKEHDVIHFSTQNETKAAMAERFNRTLKTRMWTYFTTHRTDKYLSVLQALVDAYNKSVHRSIGMRPIDVAKQHEKKIFQKLYAKRLAVAPSVAKQLGPYVRISKAKSVFDKGYQPNWTGEVFKVKQRIAQADKNVFTLEDTSGTGDPLVGRFYPEELQSVSYDPDAPQPIERIIRSRVRDGVKEHLVKWLDQPKTMNSWIVADDMVDT